jgi:transcription antitermination factor NusG
MFVADDGRGVSFIKRSYGVNDVVRQGLEPARVAQRVVNRILAREDDDGFVQLDDILTDNALRRGFRCGDAVRVNEVQFGTPIDAIFRRMRGETRALVFLCMLGRQIASEVPVRLLERAA